MTDYLLHFMALYIAVTLITNSKPIILVFLFHTISCNPLSSLYYFIFGARGGVVVKALRYAMIPDGVIGIFQ